MKKTILVTGAAGFIGFHFAKACVEAGHTVVAIDNFNDYYNVQLKHDRRKCLENQGLSVEFVDICDKEALFALFASNSFTHVVHLAAQAGVRYSFERPEVYIKTNIEGFLNVLEALRQTPKTKLIYASSSSVYGVNDKIPFSLDDNTDRPSNIYGMTKKSNELMAYSYYHLYGIQSLGMRFFTVYGPWGRPDMAYFSFTKAILEGKAIDVYNRGECYRDFTYIDDVVSALQNALDCNCGYQLFNIGNSHPESVHTLISLIEQKTKRKAVQNLLPMQKGEIEKTYADITTAEKLLQFKPKISLADGIARFVDWYIAYHNICV